MSGLAEFQRAVATGEVPARFPVALRALVAEARGDWDAAHQAVGEEGDPGSAWVHAYLHRREGDDANAAYWYAVAGRRVPALPLDREREALVAALLELLDRDSARRAGMGRAGMGDAGTEGGGRGGARRNEDCR